MGPYQLVGFYSFAWVLAVYGTNPMVNPINQWTGKKEGEGLVLNDEYQP